MQQNSFDLSTPNQIVDCPKEGESVMFGLRNHVVSPNSQVLSPNHVKLERKYYVKRNQGSIRRLGV
ncbi:hypothetical protein BOTCAL_0006g00150 [Botryotinia calthae]|uniref:Uncharacterized protein n=1 Tax=Botryotinia calthae TaxID=38488 RepID=A0A4Y8DJQ0_9HELO|nr:hypothetical protein BOTCAL_0006g00150 [Botryotinia calthae]